MTEAFVDIWHGSLSGHGNRKAELMALLSADELAKAQGLLREQARDNYVLSRGLLRSTLASYLRCEPQALQFASGEHGKPALVHHDLAFNLSHSQDKLLLAISNLPTVGVDVETIKPRQGMAGIAQRCFSPREFRYWQQLPPCEQIPQFFRLWTFKEAFVKAVGRGIALGLERCEVDVESNRGFSQIPSEHGLADNWSGQSLPLGDHLAAALVTVRQPHQLRCLLF